MTEPISTKVPGHDETEQLVEDLVAQCIAQVESTGDPQVERVCAQHPQLVKRVKRRLALLRESGLIDESLAAPKKRSGIPEQLGDFDILAEIGGGGMGVVYRAVQKSLGREVALKVIRPEQLFFAGAHERFQREVEAVARLNHPGIVPIYTFGSERGIPYYAMELVTGRSLDSILDALFDGGARTAESLSGSDLAREIVGASSADAREIGARLGPSWIQSCLRIASQVAEALAHAHERGVIHRDVKPSNILLKRDGNAVLLDFGLATLRGASKLTRTGSALGSPYFIAPEVYAKGGEAADSRSDLYSLGVTLYEMLTLRRPFEGNTDDLVARIMTGEYMPMRRVNPTIPWDVETVVQKALEIDPQRRYSSAAALARDLRNLLELRPIEAARPSPLLRARRFAQRRPGSAMGILLVFLLVVVFPLGYSLAMSAKNKEIIRERDRAKKERALAVKQSELADAHRNATLGTIDVMLTAFRDPAIAEAPGSAPIRKRVLEDAEELIDSLSPQERENPDLMRRILNLEINIANLSEVLGLGDSALERIEHVMADVSPFVKKYPDDATFALIQREARRIAAHLLSESGRTAEANAILDPLLVDLRAEYRERTDEKESATRLIDALTIAAASHQAVGDRDGYDRLLSEITELFPRIIERFPEDVSLRLQYVVRLTEIAVHAAEMGDRERATTILDRVREDLERGRSKLLDLGLDAGLYLNSWINVAMGLRALDRFVESIEILDKAISDARTMSERFPERWRFRYLLARCLVLHAEYEIGASEESDPAAAASAGEQLSEAITMLKVLQSEQPQTIAFSSDIGAAAGTLGDHLRSRGDYRGALAAYDESLTALSKLIAANPNQITDRVNACITRSQRAWTLGRIGQGVEAAAEVESARIALVALAEIAPEVAREVQPYLAENRLIAANLAMTGPLDATFVLESLERVLELEQRARMQLEVARTVDHLIEILERRTSDAEREAQLGRCTELGVRALKGYLGHSPPAADISSDPELRRLCELPRVRELLEH